MLFNIANLGLLFPTEDVIVILRFYFSLLLLFFILLDFSKTPGRIFMKFSGIVYLGLEIPQILPLWDIDNFLILNVVILWRYLLRTYSRYLLQISRMIDKALFIPRTQVSRSKCAEVR